MSRLAVIGGTGLNQLAGLEIIEDHQVETPWGSPSGPVLEGRYQGNSCLFLARHGTPHRIPPHHINYRANIWALRELGADAVLGVNAVGGIREGLVPGCLVLPDQLLDYTWGREHSYYDGVTRVEGSFDLSSCHRAEELSVLARVLAEHERDALELRGATACLEELPARWSTRPWPASRQRGSTAPWAGPTG